MYENTGTGSRSPGASTAINATAAERATFEEMFDSMNEGWGGTWDKLAAHLAEVQATA